MDKNQVKVIVNECFTKTFPGVKVRVLAHDKYGEGENAVANVLQLDWTDGPVEDAVQEALSTVDVGEWVIGCNRTYSSEAIAPVLGDLCKEFKVEAPVLLPSATGGWRFAEDRQVNKDGNAVSLQTLVFSALAQINMVRPRRPQIITVRTEKYKQTPMLVIAPAEQTKFKKDLWLSPRKVAMLMQPHVMQAMHEFHKKHSGLSDDDSE